MLRAQSFISIKCQITPQGIQEGFWVSYRGIMRICVRAACVFCYVCIKDIVLTIQYANMRHCHICKQQHQLKIHLFISIHTKCVIVYRKASLCILKSLQGINILFLDHWFTQEVHINHPPLPMCVTIHLFIFECLNKKISNFLREVRLSEGYKRFHIQEKS